MVMTSRLEALLAPVGISSFFAKYWMQRPLHVTREADISAMPISLTDIEYLTLSLISPPQGWLTVVRDGTEVNPAGLRGKAGFIDAQRLREVWAAGCTILLTNLQRRVPAVSALTRQLEIDLLQHGVALSQPIVANAYATPSKSQGFKPHFDMHDVLILQIEGRKRWRLYPPREPYPLELRRLSPDELGDPGMEVELSPGDLLYIPRGHPHDANSLQGASLHLTFSIHVHTWLDLALALLKASPDFRQGLSPIPGAAQQGTAWAKELRRRLARLEIREGTAHTAAKLFRDARLLASDPVLPSSSELESRSELALHSRIRRRYDQHLYLDTDGPMPTLSGFGGRYEGQPAEAAILAHIAAHPEFILNDLPGTLPATKLRIIDALIARSLLIADDP